MKAIISKAARRKWAWVLALVMIVSIVIPTSLLTVKADVGTVKFIDGAAGWLESAYAQWSIDNQWAVKTVTGKRIYSIYQESQPVRFCLCKNRQ